MSILLQSKSALTTFKKLNLWRILNSVTLFFSFFIPWVWGKESNIYTLTGFRILGFYQYMTWFEVFVQERELSERIRLASGLGQHFIGLYAILIYCGLNLFFAIYWSRLTNKTIWIISVLCLISLGVRSLWVTPFLDEGWRGLSFTLWGYWLTLIGLISSIALEISYFILRKT